MEQKEENSERIFYNKLCRDKIPEIIRAKGFDCEVREMDDEEYRREIVRKVFEEASGVSNHDDHAHLVSEVADVIITLEALKRAFNISEEEMHSAVVKNLAEKGSYDRHLYLSWSSDTDYVTNEKTFGFDN